MGSNVLGVLYGCKVPDGLTLRKRPGDEGEEELLDKWDAVKANRKLGLRVTGGGILLIGFWIGIGGHEKGLLDISNKCIPLTVIERTKEARAAILSWKRFAAFSKENGVNLPTATFWLAPLEIS